MIIITNYVRTQNLGAYNIMYAKPVIMKRTLLPSDDVCDKRWRLDNQGYTLGGRHHGSELFEEAHAVSAYIGITTIDVSDRSVRR